MTGFARAHGQDPASTGGIAPMSWVWEARSVNGRGLDVRVRLPSGYEMLDQAVRTGAASRFTRGNVTVNLVVQRTSADATRVRVNRALLTEILDTASDLSTRHADTVAAPRLDGLLGLRGVLESGDGEDTLEQIEARAAHMQHDLGAVLDQLRAARLDEGARLHTLIAGQLSSLGGFCAQARQTAALRPDRVRERLMTQLRTVLEADPALPEDRLLAELAVLTAKGDVREELDRLEAHVEQATELLGRGGAIGRRLDFLCQEFNREANTLCSKSGDVALTRVGLDMKVLIDQIREQVQNIE